MESVLEKVGQTLSYLDSTPMVQGIAGKTGIRPAYVAIVFILAFFFIVILGYGASLICDIVGILYPAFMSHKAAKSQDENQIKQWLAYWVLLSLLKLLEGMFTSLFQWIPFYYVLKLVLELWLMHPTYQGATYVYGKLSPILTKNQEKIDASLIAMRDRVDTKKDN